MHRYAEAFDAGRNSSVVMVLVSCGAGSFKNAYPQYTEIAGIDRIILRLLYTKGAAPQKAWPDQRGGRNCRHPHGGFVAAACTTIHMPRFPEVCEFSQTILVVIL